MLLFKEKLKEKLMELFKVYNVQVGDSIATVLMDKEFVKQVIDNKTLSLKSIKNGGIYTLVPELQPSIQAFLNLYTSHDAITNKPMEYMSSSMSRVDRLINVVGSLFKEFEYQVVESEDDLESIINRTDRKLKTEKISIFGSEFAGELEKHKIKLTKIKESEDKEGTLV